MVLISLNILFSLAQIPVILECYFKGLECRINQASSSDLAEVWSLLYKIGLLILVLIYFIEVVIFVVVIINVRSYFKYLNQETYDQLKLKLGLFIAFVLFFMLYRILYFVLLQFEIFDGNDGNE